MIAYDFDGVLCVKPPSAITKSFKKLCGFYLSAPKLYEPKDESFLIITARLLKSHPYCKYWLNKHLAKKNIKLFYYKSSYGQKSIKSIAKCKADACVANDVIKFTDDNLEILKEMRKIFTKLNYKISLFHYKGNDEFSCL